MPNFGRMRESQMVRKKQRVDSNEIQHVFGDNAASESAESKRSEDASKIDFDDYLLNHQSSILGGQSENVMSDIIIEKRPDDKLFVKIQNVD